MIEKARCDAFRAQMSSAQMSLCPNVLAPKCLRPDVSRPNVGFRDLMIERIFSNLFFVKHQNLSPELLHPSH